MLIAPGRRAAAGVRASRSVRSTDKRRAIVRAPPRPFRGLFTMANIKSQIKRNDRSERERLENRHYTSQIKTYFRRLETAVDRWRRRRRPTPSTATLVSLIDKAVKRGALHENTGARKKSRAARMRRGTPAA